MFLIFPRIFRRGRTWAKQEDVESAFEMRKQLGSIGEWVSVWVVFFISNQPYCFQIALTTVPHDKYNC